MKKTDFESMKRGLEQAAAYAAGDHSVDITHTPEEIKARIAKKATSNTKEGALKSLRRLVKEGSGIDL